jgi:immune inhibitor A
LKVFAVIEHLVQRRIVRLSLTFVAAALLFASAGASHAEERSAPRDMAQRVLSTVRPGRDPLDLAVRLRGVSPATPLIAPAVPAPLVAGLQDNFWILNQRTAQLFQSQATLRLVTEHAYWFVETDLADRAPQGDLERSAAVFEDKTYPLIHRYFGSEPSPGVDQDGHIVFFLGNVPGVAAYFSSADAYPRAINPRSNEHDMIYVNVSSLRPGQTGFDSTITHELQHMAQFAHCPTQEGWVDEGASELAMRVAGYEGSPPTSFATHPDVQLTAWSQSADVIRHYQVAYLFVRYVAERAGGWDALPTLFGTCARGESLFAAFLAQRPIAPDVESLFTDFAVANLLQDAAVADGRFAYGNGGFHAAATGAAPRGTPFLGSVPPYAANYVDLPAGGGSATFSADASVPLLAADLDSSGVWWSNRGDNLDTRLTRRLDLRDAIDATLRFQAWYDLEDQFDYVYLSASSDGGRSWRVLPGLHTTSDKATGNNYGPGWTGSSGSTWVDEEVDLTQFAGSETLVRLEYVTDQSYNGQGFALRNVSVSQIGLDEGGAVEAPWQSEGWLRVDAPVPERWNLRLVRWTPTGVQVEPVPVAADGTATFALDAAATRATLVIAPTAPRTVLPADYTLTVGP